MGSDASCVLSPESWVLSLGFLTCVPPLPHGVDRALVKLWDTFGLTASALWLLPQQPPPPAPQPLPHPDSGPCALFWAVQPPRPTPAHPSFLLVWVACSGCWPLAYLLNRLEFQASWGRGKGGEEKGGGGLSGWNYLETPYLGSEPFPPPGSGGGCAGGEICSPDPSQWPGKGLAGRAGYFHQPVVMSRRCCGADTCGCQVFRYKLRI